MQKTDFHDAVEEVLKSNSDYSADSYYFLHEVLIQAVEKQRKISGGENKHVSGLELLEAFRERMLKQFGPMSMTLLDEWGLSKTQDVYLIAKFNDDTHSISQSTIKVTIGGCGG